MGRGNFYFTDAEGLDVATYYIPTGQFEYDSDYDPYDLHLLYDEEWDGITENIQSIEGLQAVHRWSKRDTRVIAENGVLEVSVADNEWAMAVACVPKRDDYGRILPSYRKSAQRIMRAIHEVYGLYIRTSAWTSGKIEGENYQFY